MTFLAPCLSPDELSQGTVDGIIGSFPATRPAPPTQCSDPSPSAPA